MNELNIPDCHTKLLPCPFCGNDNIHVTKKPLWNQYDGCYHGYKDRYAFEVICDRCGAHPTYYKNDTIYRPEEEAISHVVINDDTLGSLPCSATDSLAIGNTATSEWALERAENKFLVNDTVEACP